MPRSSRSIAVGAAVAIALVVLGVSALYDMAREDARARVAALIAEEQVRQAQEQTIESADPSGADGSDDAAGDAIEPEREGETAPMQAEGDRDRMDGEVPASTEVEATPASPAGEEGTRGTAPAELAAQGEVPGEASAVATAEEEPVAELKAADGAPTEEEMVSTAGVQADAQQAESPMQPDSAVAAVTPPEETAVPASDEETAISPAAADSDDAEADAGPAVSVASDVEEPPAPAGQDVEEPAPAVASPTGSAEDSAVPSTMVESGDAGDAGTAAAPAPAAEEAPAPLAEEVDESMPVVAPPSVPVEDPAAPSTMAESEEPAGHADTSPAPAHVAEEAPAPSAAGADELAPAPAAPSVPPEDPVPPSTMAEAEEAAGDAVTSATTAPAAEEAPAPLAEEVDESMPVAATPSVPADPASSSAPVGSENVAGDVDTAAAPAPLAEERPAPGAEEADESVPAEDAAPPTVTSEAETPMPLAEADESVPAEDAAPPTVTSEAETPMPLAEADESVPEEDAAPSTVMSEAETPMPLADAAPASTAETQAADAAAAGSDDAADSPAGEAVPPEPADSPTSQPVVADREESPVRAPPVATLDPSERVPPAEPDTADSTESPREAPAGDTDEPVVAEVPAPVSAESAPGDSANGTTPVAPAPQDESTARAGGVDDPDDGVASAPADAQQVAALPDTVVDDPAPDRVPAAVPEETPSPDPARPVAPADVAQFDVVQVSPDGTVVVAGRTRPGSRVELLIDGEVITSADTNRNGEFVFVPDVQLLPGVRELSVAVLPPNAQDRRLASRIVVVLIPDREMFAARATEPVESLPSEAPIALLVDEQGEAVGVIQPSPEMIDPDNVLSLAAVTFDQKGYASITGGGEAGLRITVYLDNEATGSVIIGEDGFWTVRTQHPLAKTGTYKLRIDQTGANDDAVTERIVTTLIRAGGRLIPMSATVVTVEKGMTLWGISRRHYGRGILYTLIYNSNSYQIADPHWIYPDQKFLIPERQ